MLDPENDDDGGQPRQRRPKLSSNQTKKTCLNCNKTLDLSRFYSTMRPGRKRLTYSASCRVCTNQLRRGKHKPAAGPRPPTKSVIALYRDDRAFGGELTLVLTKARTGDQMYFYIPAGNDQWVFDVLVLLIHGGVRLKLGSLLDEYNRIIADHTAKITATHQDYTKPHNTTKPQKGTNQ